MRRTYVAILVILFLVLYASGPDIYVLAENLSIDSEESCDVLDGELVEDSEEIQANGPQLFSETAVLIDADSGQVLFEKKMNKRMYPASITKVLTALLAIEHGNPEQKLTMSERAVFSIERGSSHIALDMDEEIKLEQAIYGISIASGNDAANGIAETIGGTLEGFADMMNERAIAAGADNSNFVNAHGLPDDNHYTTAYDMGMIMRACINEPQFLTYFSESLYEIPPTNKQTETRFLHNANCLINGTIECEGILVSKTGYTNAAGNTLISAARRNGRTLIAVVMKSSGRNDKFHDTNALFDYGFEEFREVTITADSIVKQISGHSIEGIESDSVYYSNSDVSLYLHNSINVSDIVIDYKIPSTSSDDQEASAIIKLDQAANDGIMYSPLVTLNLESTSEEQLTVVGTDSPGAAGSSGGQVNAAQDFLHVESEASRGVFLKRVMPASAIVILLTFVFLYLRERKRRRRRRKLERLRRQYNIRPYRID